MFWVEVHCDTSQEERELLWPTDQCRTHAGDIPGALGYMVGKAARRAEAEARDKGWRKIGGLWACPAYQTILKPKEGKNQ